MDTRIEILHHHRWDADLYSERFQGRDEARAHLKARGWAYDYEAKVWRRRGDTARIVSSAPPRGVLVRFWAAPNSSPFQQLEFPTVEAAVSTITLWGYSRDPKRTDTFVRDNVEATIRAL